jgi:hypothetical protein
MGRSSESKRDRLSLLEKALEGLWFNLTGVSRSRKKQQNSKNPMDDSAF